MGGATVELARRLAVQTVIGGIGNQDRARLSQGFQTGCNIDPIAKDILLLENNLADMNADTKPNDVMVFQTVLNIERAVYGIRNAGEFDDPAIAHAFDDIAAMRHYSGFEQLAPEFPEDIKRARLILPHKTGIIHDIGGNDGG